jgi:two-component system, LytTR family, sensor kinase
MRLPPRRDLLLGFGFATALGLVLFGYQYLDVIAREGSEPFGIKLIEELSSAYGTLLLVPLVAWWTRHVRAHAGSASGMVLRHVPALAVFSFLHTSWNAVVRPVAFHAAGLGTYDYGVMSVRYAMEFSVHIVVYSVIVACIALYDHRRALRDRETRLARAEAELSAARMHALEARLHPHFLFNALNTVSSVMYDDIDAADRMLVRLSELLRRALRDTDAEVPLRDELETLELWIDVMRMRFEDRLVVSIDVPEDVRAALVPPLLLQPLLENAVEHGDPGPRIAAHIDVSALSSDGMLHVEVADNGPGLSVSAEEALTRGIGLSTTAHRLELMYDGAAGISLRKRPGGGLLVAVSLPFRRGDNAAAQRVDAPRERNAAWTT